MFFFKILKTVYPNEKLFKLKCEEESCETVSGLNNIVFCFVLVIARILTKVLKSVKGAGYFVFVDE